MLTNFLWSGDPTLPILYNQILWETYTRLQWPNICCCSELVCSMMWCIAFQLPHRSKDPAGRSGFQTGIATKTSITSPQSCRFYLTVNVNGSRSPKRITVYKQQRSTNDVRSNKFGCPFRTPQQLPPRWWTLSLWLLCYCYDNNNYYYVSIGRKPWSLSGAPVFYSLTPREKTEARIKGWGRGGVYWEWSSAPVCLWVNLSMNNEQRLDAGDVRSLWSHHSFLPSSNLYYVNSSRIS